MSASSLSISPRSGGKILADQLRLLGAKRLFCVPGESFLGLLDGLYDHEDAIDVITCRHESGAAVMAEAYGKMTGVPGLCAVTRGPGATNASNGVHTAFQDSTPMILFIGQVSRDMLDREAFQEIDYRRMFGQMAKWVAQIDDPARIPEYIARAWHTALSGRPGPVVLALPEDVLTELAETRDLSPLPPVEPAPPPAAMARFEQMLSKARRPVLAIGGPGWSAECAAQVAQIAERFALPVVTSFRCQDYIDNTHPNYAGTLGIGPDPVLRQRVTEECDLLIVIGARLGEMTTQGYTLLDIPVPQMPVVQVHPDPVTSGQVYQTALPVASSATAFLDAWTGLKSDAGAETRADWVAANAAAYRAFQEPGPTPGPLHMAEVIRHLSDTMPEETIYCNGAGTYATWLHRFHRYRGWRTQLAPTSGSMGYGVPAAISAKLENPEAPVISLAGDGCFLMTAQELATAQHHSVGVIWLVVNNGMYGTIRMHQERAYPTREISTALTNPDFVAYAAAFGIPGECVRETADFAGALSRARQSEAGYLIELVIDPESLTPTQSLSDVRDAALARRG